MPTRASPEPRTQSLTIKVAASGLANDASVRETTDRAVRFAITRFGDHVRSVRVSFSHPTTEACGCALRVTLRTGDSFEVEAVGRTPELALQRSLVGAAHQVAQAMGMPSRHRA